MTPGAAAGEGTGRLIGAGQVAGTGPHAIRQAAVVIPVHNEEQHLERALAAVSAAAGRVNAGLPGVGVQVVVVLDSYTDRSLRMAEAFAAEYEPCVVLPVNYRSVGKSRRAGAKAALESAGSAAQAGGTAADEEMHGVWLANTDADSCVPEHWLVRQLELAAAGADVVLGTVQPDPSSTHHELLARWHARHVFVEHHTHVYGANLGVRASSYLDAGGFPAVDFDEDRTLVERLRAGGAEIVGTDTTRILTSGRTGGRAPRGFAAYLLALAQQ